MKKQDFLYDLCIRLADAVPSGLKDAKQDIEKNFHAILQKAFAKMELVTREEFDSQTKVLARTRQKLEKLEKEVRDLEEALNQKSHG